MAEIKATLSAVYYDGKGVNAGLAYTTTIPVSVPIETAERIINDIVCKHFSHTENVNNALKTFGALTGITANLGQDCYSFTVGKHPKSAPEEIIYPYAP